MKKLVLLPLLLLPTWVLAHPGHEQTSISLGLVNGALHPLLGLDHLLALLAVGILSAQAKGQHRFWVPVTFIAMMGLGFYGAHAGVHGLASGTIETLIMMSLFVGGGFVLVASVLKRYQILTQLGAWGMTGFAVFHGLAHGLEVPAEAGLNSFAFGFLFMASVLIAVSYQAWKQLSRRITHIATR